ncbi:G5 domain-containing protein, partial [Globicatella sp. HMSC072A10]|uniref:G5 domain-containing protein n=2 Tax=Globicatella TaxID=13075 RepID=UPI00114D3656
TKSENGETKQTKAPVKRIVEVGPGTTDGTHTYTSKKPFEVEVRVNPELKKGEHKVVQQGVEGEEEYTITIENSKVTNTSEPKETKAPVNEIIEVGTEDFTGTHETKKTKAIEFET